MLTVELATLGLGPGARVLDLGCGGGRHAFAALRAGAVVVALDRSEGDLKDVRGVVGAMTDAGELAPDTPWGTVTGDAEHLPFPDAAFDAVIAAEVLEHIWADRRALAELERVLRPGGRIAVTVPSALPERLCWALDPGYHDTPGGHVRIYRRRDLEARLVEAGLVPYAHHRAHALHSPYWWIRCAGGVDRPERPLARRYHELLVWQITRDPRWLAALERGLNPLLGKSLVVYARKELRPR